MDIRQQLINNFPKTIDVTKPFFGAIVSNEKRTGATEKVLEEARNYSLEYVNNPKIMDQTGEMLEKSMRFLTYLPRFTNESEEGWKRRYKAIFIRGHNSTWGTPFDIKQVFKSYFPTANIYLVENTNHIDDNLIIDGDFIDDKGLAWIFTNGAKLDVEARFSKKNGVNLGNAGTLKQTIKEINQKCYYLHFFSKGGVGVSIYHTSGTSKRYWNNETHEWQNNSYTITHSSDIWENNSIYLYNQNEKAKEITIEFKRNTYNDYCYIDYIRFFEKQPYPSFSLITQFEGEAVSNVISLVPGRADSKDKETFDPEPPFKGNPKYFSFFDQDALTGVSTGFSQDVYQDLLDMVKPAGCKAYMEIINKDYIAKI